MARFADRVQAGQLLAESLRQYANGPDVIVLGLPRGGVPVAAAVAEALQVRLDVFVVRKLGFPGEEELAMGAIASGGIQVLNEDVIGFLHVPSATIEEVRQAQAAELARRELLYRGKRKLPELRGTTVILVDDGLATGSTMRAAVAAVRKHAPARVVVAVPVGAEAACSDLARLADESVCLHCPEQFTSVGSWYDDFTQTSDEEVQQLLGEGDRWIAK